MSSNASARALAPAAESQPQSASARWSKVQRKCACGGDADASGECEACRKKREQGVQRSALGSSPVGGAPQSVHQALREGGTPLDAHTRAFFESRLGHDFGQVRVHTTSLASQSAAAIDAHAYTVGNHVVFGAGKYGPQSHAGRRLLAHELAHVVQQSRGGARVQASSVATAPHLTISPEDDELERDAESTADRVMSGGFASRPSNSVQRLLIQRTPAIVGLDEAGPDADLTGKTDDALLACMAGAKDDPLACTPNRALTWADFAGAPRGGQFSAETASGITDQPMDPVKAGCLQRILGKSKDQTRVFQAKLDTSKSWVRAMFKTPTNTALTGCTKDAAACRSFFAKPKNAGGSFTFSGTPNPDCDASIVAGSVTASATADCANIETECTNTAVAESQRLLAHEQGHFDISCAIAAKANSALLAGGDLAKIKTATQKQLTDTQKAYDDESTHGCDPSGQATWVSEIAKGLPKVSVP